MTVTTGLPDPKHNFSFPQVTLTAEERTVKGSYVGSCVPTRDIPLSLTLLLQVSLQLQILIAFQIDLFLVSIDKLQK